MFYCVCFNLIADHSAVPVPPLAPPISLPSIDGQIVSGIDFLYLQVHSSNYCFLVQLVAVLLAISRVYQSSPLWMIAHYQVLLVPKLLIIPHLLIAVAGILLSCEFVCMFARYNFISYEQNNDIFFENGKLLILASFVVS